jgi:putative transposase
MQQDLESACRNTVAKAMRQLGLQSRVTKAFKPITTQTDLTKKPGTQQTESRFPSRRPRSQVGDRYHVSAYGDWMGLPGGGAGFV